MREQLDDPPEIGVAMVDGRLMVRFRATPTSDRFLIGPEYAVEIGAALIEAARIAKGEDGKKN